MHLRSLLACFALTVTAAIANANDNAHHHAPANGDIRITHSYARATVPHQPSGAAYLTIENQGNETDKLLAMESPAAKTVQIHAMAMEGNIMKMHEVSDFALKPSETVEMKPGNGYHVMLIGLRQPLKAGESFPLTLTFENAGKIEVSVHVQAMGNMEHKHQHDGGTGHSQH